MSVTGGDPGTISAGSREMANAAKAVGSNAKGISSAGSSASGAAGDGRISAAVDRFTAAWSQTVADLQTQMEAAAQLADSGAADLATAGGERPR